MNQNGSNQWHFEFSNLRTRPFGIILVKRTVKLEKALKNEMQDFFEWGGIKLWWQNQGHKR